jgi:hypothetical protein
MGFVPVPANALENGRAVVKSMGHDPDLRISEWDDLSAKERVWARRHIWNLLKKQLHARPAQPQLREQRPLYATL